MLLFRHSLSRAGVVLGLGLGGFLDGILLHQILGWHHLVCTTETCRPETVEVLQRQNMQDGFFHLVAWVLTVIGVAALWRARMSVEMGAGGRLVAASALGGWGLFNLVEGTINHQVLSLHHVRPASPHWAYYDAAFLASGVVLILVGEILLRYSLPKLRMPASW